MNETENNETENVLTTRTFRMSGGRFATEMIFRYGGKWLLALLVTAVVGIVCGIITDWRWLLVALMLIFVVTPMILAFVYFYYGLRRECYVNSVRHSLAFGESVITARLEFPQGVDEETGEQLPDKVRCEVFPYDILRPFVVGSDAVIILLKRPYHGFLWMPADAFESPETMESVLRLLDSKTTAT